MKALQRWKQQFKNNNQGSSLVTVMVIVSLAVIMVTVILAMTLLNYYMKEQNLKRQRNFYDAESAVEEIRLGLTTEVSNAAQIAYVTTLSNYGPDTETETKNQKFRKRYREELQKRLSVEVGNIRYYCIEPDVSASVKGISSYLRETRWDDGSGTGARILTAAGRENVLNQGEGSDPTVAVVLKNVKVSYLDYEDNYTEISTDITLGYPEIDFTDTSSMDNILCYALIAADCLEMTNPLDIVGNSYLGSNPVKLGSASGSGPGLRLTLDSVSPTNGYTIFGGGLEGDRNADIRVNNMQLWAEHMTLSGGSACDVADGCVLYLQNDLVLNKDAKATMRGEFYAYGNPEAAKSAECASIDAAAVNGKEADYSSSIIINGSNATLDMRGVTDLLISGVNYINKSASNYSRSKNQEKAGSSDSIPMGHSIATKADQRAYLIPGELIGPGLENGGLNPMTAEQKAALDNEILKRRVMLKKGYESISMVTDAEVAELTAEERRILPTDWISFTDPIMGLQASLDTLGASRDYEQCAIAVPGVGTMYYYFMKFDSQEKLNAFTRRYYQKATNYHQLQVDLSYYTSFGKAGGGIQLPEIDSVYGFYLQGNAIATNQNSLMLGDSLSIAGDYTQELLKLEGTCLDAFRALNRKLTNNYEQVKTLPDDLFSNLVDKNSVIGKKVFTADNGKQAVVSSMSYTVSDSDPDVCLVISKGDVTVKRDFEGLILCAGKIRVTEDVTITAKPEDVATVMNVTDSDGKSPADYVKGAEAYLMGGISSAAGDSGTVELGKQVKYKNWKKR